VRSVRLGLAFVMTLCVVHPHLPSFPTRRSSDLRVEEGGADTGVSCRGGSLREGAAGVASRGRYRVNVLPAPTSLATESSPPSRADRKSTRLNSSHVKISYAVFCLKKKNQNK